MEPIFYRAFLEVGVSVKTDTLCYNLVLFCLEALIWINKSRLIEAYVSGKLEKREVKIMYVRKAYAQSYWSAKLFMEGCT